MRVSEWMGEAGASLTTRTPLWMWGKKPSKLDETRLGLRPRQKSPSIDNSAISNKVYGIDKSATSNKVFQVDDSAISDKVHLC